MKKLRIAVIGFGFMGKTHAKNILDSELMELSAIVDKRAGAITQVSGNIDTGGIDNDVLDKISKYNCLDECLAKEKLDAVFICVHTLLHFEMAMKCLQNGLHVFIEKPFVINIKEGELLIAEARKRGLILAVGHVVRFMPAYIKLRDFFKAGTYGKMRFISLTRFSGVPNWGEWGRRRDDFGSSGGALFDLVIHDIDFLRYMLGMPDSVDSVCLPGELSNHDYISAFLHYPDSDICVKVEGGLIFHSMFPFEATIKASFEKASVAWSSSNGHVMKIAYNDDLQEIELGDANDGYVIEDELFAGSILNRNCNNEHIADSALDTIKLCHRFITKNNVIT